MAADVDLVDLHGRMVPRWYAEHIRALVDEAPPLTAHQVEVLGVLLRPAEPASPQRARGRQSHP